MRIRVIVWSTLALVAALSLAGYIFLRNLDLDDYKDVIAAELKDILSRDVDFKGHITFTLSLKPTVTARDVTMANASWSEQGPMLDIERLDATINLLELLFWDIDITELDFQGGILRLERKADGRANWDLGIDEQDIRQAEDLLGGPFPYISVVRFRDMEVSYSDEASRQSLSGHVKTLAAFADRSGRQLRTVFEAKVKGQTLAANGTVADMKSLYTGGSSSVTFSVGLDATKLSIDGVVNAGGQAEIFQGRFDAVSPGTGDLAKFAEISVPYLGAFKAEGKATVTQTSLDLNDLKAQIGPSDLSGQAMIAFGQDPSVSVDLTSKVFDITPILKEWGQDDDGVAEPGPDRSLVFSDDPLPFDQIPSLNADLKLAIEQLIAGDVSFDVAELQYTQSGKNLKIDPFKIEYKGASFSGSATVDDGESPSVTLKILTQNFDLGSFLNEQKVTDLVEGEIDVGIDVAGHGRSLHAIVSKLDGKAAFVVGKGRIASRYVDLIATDLLKELMPWKKGVDETVIKCALGQFDISGGLAKTQSLLFDTKEMTMTGRGTINLENEKIDFTLYPRPKDPTLISLATGLRVTGTLLDTHLSLDPISLLKEAAEGAIGVLLFGPAGILIPFASLGAGHHHPCVNDLQKVFGIVDGKTAGGGTDGTASGENQDAASGQSSTIPTSILLSVAGDQVNVSTMQRDLEELGFTNIMKIDKEGSIFHVDAEWQGKALALRIDARTGTIDHKNR